MLEKSIFGLIMTFWDITKLPFRKLDLYSVIWVGYVIVKDFCQVSHFLWHAILNWNQTILGNRLSFSEIGHYSL